MRRALIGKGADLEPVICAHCGKRMIYGIVYSVKIDGEKFRVCSFECSDALKESKKEKASANRSFISERASRK